MKELTPIELKAKLDDGEDIQVIDIREFHEVESGNINGLHIPMAEIMTRLDEIRKDCPVVIHCRSGARSSAIVYALESQAGYDNVSNLAGGLMAWAETIDPEMTVY